MPRFLAGSAERRCQISEFAGTFAGLGLALNGLATAVIVPLLAGLIR